MTTPDPNQLMVDATVSWLASLTDEQFAVITARARPPKDEPQQPKQAADEPAYPASWLPNTRSDR